MELGSACRVSYVHVYITNTCAVCLQSVGLLVYTNSVLATCGWRENKAQDIGCVLYPNREFFSKGGIKRRCDPRGTGGVKEGGREGVRRRREGGKQASLYPETSIECALNKGTEIETTHSQVV